ncbi:hypothetical protein ACEZ3G_00840 [Maribacter algicola]|uniref:Uncharacterized protein n=1 Tax=Meishania litoralis TaxID=3434685 RepID=A0ACC7LGB3_9FLAO
MYSKAILTLVVTFFLFFSASAQSCTLDIGGKNIDLIVKVFQLNEKQVTAMEEIRAELEVTSKAIKDDIQKLFDQHPQSSPEQLTTLAEKYKMLQQKLIDASYESDKKLLVMFNERQYERYLSLCVEALLDPIRVDPVQMGDAVDPK